MSDSAVRAFASRAQAAVDLAEPIAAESALAAVPMAGARRTRAEGADRERNDDAALVLPGAALGWQPIVILSDLREQIVDASTIGDLPQLDQRRCRPDALATRSTSGPDPDGPPGPAESLLLAETARRKSTRRASRLPRSSR